MKKYTLHAAVAAFLMTTVLAIGGYEKIYADSYSGSYVDAYVTVPSGATAYGSVYADGWYGQSSYAGIDGPTSGSTVYVYASGNTFDSDDFYGPSGDYYLYASNLGDSSAATAEIGW